MLRRGHRGRVDANHAALMAAARALGWSAVSIATVGDGCPDAIVAKGERTYLVEFKAGTKTLTPAEERWHREWLGVVHIVRDVTDLLTLLDVTD